MNVCLHVQAAKRWTAIPIHEEISKIIYTLAGGNNNNNRQWLVHTVSPGFLPIQLPREQLWLPSCRRDGTWELCLGQSRACGLQGRASALPCLRPLLESGGFAFILAHCLARDLSATARLYRCWMTLPISSYLMTEAFQEKDQVSASFAHFLLFWETGQGQRSMAV